MDIIAINDESFLIQFKNEISLDIHMKVKYYYSFIKENLRLKSCVSGYNSILVKYDILNDSFVDIKNKINSLDYKVKKKETKRKIVYIPVCYDEEYAVDINRVSKHNNLDIKEVINKHTSKEYLVYMIGFTPGFPYLGGMDESISTPRLDVPRTKISKGSVGIGGEQTGIYPLDTPGGWNIIGKTPVSLFDAKREIPSLLEMGNYIKFEEITKEEYIEIEKEVLNNTYQIRIEVK